MELRAELRPPVLDEAKVKRLSRLAATLDGARTDRSDELVARFNAEAGTSYGFQDFHGIYGVCDRETWVRSVLHSSAIKRIADITFDELVELTRRVLTTNGNEEEINFWVNLLSANVPE